MEEQQRTGFVCGLLSSNVASSYATGVSFHLPQSGVLHCDLAKEEVDIVAILDGVQEVRLCLEVDM